MTLDQLVKATLHYEFIASGPDCPCDHPLTNHVFEIREVGKTTFHTSLQDVLIASRRLMTAERLAVFKLNELKKKYGENILKQMGVE